MITAGLRRLHWWWAMRDCPHPHHRLRRIWGDEFMTYGYPWWCRDCGRPVKEKPE